MTDKKETRTGSNKVIKTTKQIAIQKQEKSGTLPILDLIREQTVEKAVSSAQFADPFIEFYAGQDTTSSEYQPIQPTYNPNILKRLPIENNILLQCIEAMVKNIAGTGFDFEYIGPDDDKAKEGAESQAELKRLKAFVSAPNEEYSMVELRKRIRRDQETYGYAFMEVMRDLKGNVFSAYHIPAHTMRITSPESTAVKVDYNVIREGETVKIPRMKKFRRFVQFLDAAGIKKLYFKEYGDTRLISCEDGKVYGSLDIEKRASEVIFLADYKSGHLYGYPRWINQLPSVLGSRQSEIVNLDFFNDNAIPAMVVLVSGGYISTDSVEAIAEKFNGERGRKKMHEVLIIEATADENASSPEGVLPVPKLEIKPLAGDRQNDMLFQEYDEKSRMKIRSAFRLPPIILGESTDYNRATADAAIVVAEAQVFQPERDVDDELINKCLLSDGVNLPKLWRYRSNSSRIFDKEDLVNSIEKLEKSGALTPNAAILLANQILGTKIAQVEAEWGNYPYSMVIEIVKKKGTMLAGIEEIVEQVEEAATSATQTTASSKEPTRAKQPKKPATQEQTAKILTSFTSNIKDAIDEVKAYNHA